MKTSKKTRLESQCFMATLTLVMLMWAGIPASGQSTMPQPSPVGPPTIQPRDADTKQWQVAAFDKFLDGHPEVAAQLRNNPSLVNNEEFVEHHPALQQFLQEHRGIREEISENPNAFMRQESRFDQREEQREGREREENRGDRDARTHGVVVFDRFLDRHPELAEQLRKDPTLLNNEQFVENHPALQQFVRDNPGIGTEINENPKAFMHQEERLDRHDDTFDRSDDRSNTMGDRNDRAATGDRDERATTVDRDARTTTGERDERVTAQDRDERATTADRDERASTVDRDRATGETIAGARATGAATDDRDTTTAELTSTDRFLDSHPEIAEQLRKNPSLINDKDFVKQHPALQDYLKSNPQVGEEIRENPNAFMRQEARFDQREALTHRSTDRDDMASFGAFLGTHGSLAQELSKNPSLANNKEFQASHPELREFLKAHPAVQAQLSTNPQTAMSSVQASNAAAASTANPASTAKPPSTTKPPSVVKPPTTTKPEIMH